MESNLTPQLVLLLLEQVRLGQPINANPDTLFWTDDLQRARYEQDGLQVFPIQRPEPPPPGAKEKK